ncbi:MAG TPA: AMP-binding protein [Burkholderiaceae bacterium]|nr:AMP-binding protein [Burkholderiaceae bacterium]
MHTNLIFSQGETTLAVSRVLQALPHDEAANHGYRYRVIDTSHPAICMFHMLAAWMQGQVAVMVGNAETAAEFLEPGSFVVVKNAPFEKGKASVKDDVVYAQMQFPASSIAPAAMVLSSGTTGKPKGILLTRQGIEASCDILVDIFKMTPDETYGNLSPVHSMGGLRSFMLALRYGCSIHFFTNAKLQGVAYAQTVLDSGCVVILTGASFVRLVSTSMNWLSFKSSKLRAMMSCGSLYDEVASHAVQKQTGIEVVNAYGQTETSGLVMCEALGVYRPKRMPPPMKHVRQHFRLIEDDVYELGIEYPNSFHGYVGLAPHIDPIIWTGDYVQKHPDGITFQGRQGHAMKTTSADSWLFPELVENWLRDMAQVKDASVRPLPDHSGLWCVVHADQLPTDLKARLVAAIGKEYASIKMYAGYVSRTPAGKLIDMKAHSPLAPVFKA